jgi:hypothetical protein
VDRSQADIATARTNAAALLQVVEERTDQRCVQIRQRKLRGGFVEPLLGIAQQQAEGVPVAGEGMGTGALLLHQPLGEERL